MGAVDGGHGRTLSETDEYQGRQLLPESCEMPMAMNGRACHKTTRSARFQSQLCGLDLGGGGQDLVL